MVLQRDIPNPIWGWTSPGATVTVSLGGRTASGVADRGGKWVVRIRPPRPGGPYTMAIDGPTHLKLTDLLVGDVWVCGGQSNMEMGLNAVKDGPAEVANSSHPEIRLAMVQRDTQLDPRPWTPVKWSVCGPDTVSKGGWNGFSAVGYFFGRELNKRLHVPIGLVQDCWGGTPVESWVSRPVLEKQGDFSAVLTRIDEAKQSNSAAYGQQMDSWLQKVDPGSKPESGWEAPGLDDSGWKPVPSMPASYASLGFDYFPGVVWFRGEIDLPGSLPGGDATLDLGAIDDLDATWVNGQRVGETYVYNKPREYRVPGSILRPGKNLIAIRDMCTGAGGGFTWSGDQVCLKLGDGTKLPLSHGVWRFATGPNWWSQPAIPQPLENNQYIPTVLYNAMIQPIATLGIKGAIWYQGESNAGRAYQYRTLLPDMIGDWRAAWGEGDFPFLVVQLANFQTRAPQPGESDWAELREAQAMTAANVRNAGLASAADIGDAVDIHPKDKQTVGLRLALAALHTAYGQRLPYAGPTYRSLQREGGAVRLRFDHTDGGLKVKGDRLAGFAIAGTYRKFHWAEARIEGDSVVVRSSEVSDPVAVRYGWANNPELTLYNGYDLPAIPFRTDDWPGVTFGRK